MININGVVWRIFLVSPNHPALQRNDSSFALGCCDSNLKAIFINDNIKDCLYLKKVLCHEIVHACMYSYDVPLNYYQEEAVADLIATYGQEIIYITNSFISCPKK